MIIRKEYEINFGLMHLKHELHSVLNNKIVEICPHYFTKSFFKRKIFGINKQDNTKHVLRH